MPIQHSITVAVIFAHHGENVHRSTSIVACYLMPSPASHGGFWNHCGSGLLKNHIYCLQWGRTSTLPSEDVDHGVLIRSGAITHSTHFDQRMVILATTSNSPVTSQSVGGLNTRSGTIVVQMPPSNLVAPPGLYMLFLLGKDNTPSPALYVSLGVPVPANAPQPPQDSGALI